MSRNTLSVVVSVLAVIALGPMDARADFSARVVTVQEGDRLLIYHDGKKDTIYLQDVDCPELKQPHGVRAKHVTQTYVGGREVIVRNFRRDKQGRTTAEIILPNGRNLGHELLKEGMAWWRKFDSKDASLGQIETLVRAEGKGLWADAIRVRSQRLRHHAAGGHERSAPHRSLYAVCGERRQAGAGRQRLDGNPR